jgi:hypothetical protein
VRWGELSTMRHGTWPLVVPRRRWSWRSRHYSTLSQELAKIRGPAFYQETVVTDAQARDWVQRVVRALQFGEDLLTRLRKTL